MSRSYKKTAGSGITTARSDKEYKISEHRRYRAVIRDLLVHGEEDSFPNYKKKYGDTWGAPKDGKCVWYWSLNHYLNTCTIYTSARIGPFYVPYWREHILPTDAAPIRRMVYTERPATRGDWKKDWIGK